MSYPSYLNTEGLRLDIPVDQLTGVNLNLIPQSCHRVDLRIVTQLKDPKTATTTILDVICKRPECPNPDCRLHRVTDLDSLT
ncbi:MAG TPA: hypothetical protein VF828_00055 [Patescibacteria group bacterium]